MSLPKIVPTPPLPELRHFLIPIREPHLCIHSTLTAIDLLFITLDPLDETLTDFLYILICDFELEAVIEKANKANKVGVVFWTLKPLLHQNRAEIDSSE